MFTRTLSIELTVLSFGGSDFSLSSLSVLSWIWDMVSGVIIVLQGVHLGKDSEVNLVQKHTLGGSLQTYRHRMSIVFI